MAAKKKAKKKAKAKKTTRPQVVYLVWTAEEEGPHRMSGVWGSARQVLRACSVPEEGIADLARELTRGEGVADLPEGCGLPAGTPDAPLPARPTRIQCAIINRG